LFADVGKGGCSHQSMPSVQQLPHVEAPGFEITSILRDSPGVANGTEDTGIRGNFCFLKNWLLFSSSVFNHPSRRRWEPPVYKQ
jgi:hypothetical protein